MANDESTSQCLICLEPFFEQNKLVGALKCGHVYHRDCVVLWFADGKAECPACKRRCRIDDVRTLAFDVKQMPPTHTAEELKALEAATLEERERRRDELCKEKGEVEALSSSIDSDLAALRELAQGYKRKRLDLQQEFEEFKEDYEVCSKEVHEELSACAEIRAGIDAEATRLQRKMPVNQPRDGDQDLHEERRKLRAGLKPSERALQLHDAVVSALQQENEKIRDRNHREAASRKAEAELRDLRQEEVQLRRELEDRRANFAAELSSQASSQSSSLPSSATSAATSQAALAAPTSLRPRSGQVPIEVATPHGGAEVLLANDDEDTNMLYGGAPVRRKGSGNVLGVAAARGSLDRGDLARSTAASAGAAVKPGGGKWGSLFSKSSAAARGALPTSAAPPPTLRTPTPAGGNSSMKTLFANRRM